MLRDPFSPFRKRPIEHSTNPRVIRNREYVEAKKGLDIALHREDGNFRAAKTRSLQRMRKSKAWLLQTPAERKKTEHDLIDKLTKKYDSKKQELEFQWRLKVETEESEETSDSVNKGVEEGEERQDGHEESVDEQDWVAPEVDDSGWVTEDDDDVEVVINKSLKDIPVVELIKRSGEEWLNKIKDVEAAAEKKEAAWQGYKANTPEQKKRV